MAKLKKCTKCQAEKVLSDYHVDKGQKTGLSPQCKTCRAKRMKAFRESPKGAKQRAYEKLPHRRAKNIERSRLYRKSGKKAVSDKKYNKSEKGRNYHLQHYYSITLEQYTEILLDQKGVCAICGSPETCSDGIDGIRPLAVDHDHKTGKIRGLLCNMCNKMLGCARDNTETLIRGAKYLKEHK